MDVEVAFIGVPVSELATGRAFFERLLGRPPDVVVNADEVMWRLADRPGSTSSSIRRGPGTPWRRSRSAISTPPWPSSSGRGVSAASVEQVGDAARKATVHDPDGNSIALIEVAG